MFRARVPKQIDEAPAPIRPAPVAVFAEHALFDPMPLPEVTEIDPAEGWALWNALIQGKSAAEADTVLMDLLPA